MALLDKYPEIFSDDDSSDEDMSMSDCGSRFRALDKNFTSAFADSDDSFEAEIDEKQSTKWMCNPIDLKLGDLNSEICIGSPVALTQEKRKAYMDMIYSKPPAARARLYSRVGISIFRFEKNGTLGRRLLISGPSRNDVANFNLSSVRCSARRSVAPDQRSEFSALRLTLDYTHCAKFTYPSTNITDGCTECCTKGQTAVSQREIGLNSEKIRSAGVMKSQNAQKHRV